VQMKAWAFDPLVTDQLRLVGAVLIQDQEHI